MTTPVDRIKAYLDKHDNAYPTAAHIDGFIEHGGKSTNLTVSDLRAVLAENERLERDYYTACKLADAKAARVLELRRSEKALQSDNAKLMELIKIFADQYRHYSDEELLIVFPPFAVREMKLRAVLRDMGAYDV